MLTAIKGKIDSNTVIVGGFNMPLISMDRSSRQKISKEIQALNDTLDLTDLIDNYRAFHLKAECTFFSSAHGTFSTCWVTNQTSRNLRKLKSYQASFPNTTLRD